jgi:uncharacterized membrane protein
MVLLLFVRVYLYVLFRFWVNQSLLNFVMICLCRTVATLTLGSQPKQWLAKVRAKSEARESHFMFPGV